MAKLSTLFDATKVAPQAPRVLIPKGTKVVAQLIKSEMKPVKKTKGASYLALVFEIILGEFKGRQLFNNLNLVNPNAQAAEIANAELSAICHATGVMRVADTLELHNKPMQLTVGVEEATYDGDKLLYPEKNSIAAYEPVEGAAPVAAGATPGAGAPKWLKPAEPATPAPAPAAPAAKGPPVNKPTPAPAPAPVAAPVVDEGPYYVQIGEETSEHSGSEIIAMLAEGMPSDTPICKEGDTEWKTAADYGLPPAAPAPAAPAAKKAPWKK